MLGVMNPSSQRYFFRHIHVGLALTKVIKLLEDSWMALTNPTWWLIPLRKWVITPVINGISRVNPLITPLNHQAFRMRPWTLEVVKRFLAPREPNIRFARSFIPNLGLVAEDDHFLWTTKD